MEFTLDRIEDSIAVLIDGDGKIYECSSGLLPENAREGDVFTSDEYPFSKDFAPIPKPQKRRQRSERIKDLFEKLKNKNGHIER